MTSRTFTSTGRGNTRTDWAGFAQEKANDYGYAWLYYDPVGKAWGVRASGTLDDEPYDTDSFYVSDFQPVPRSGLPVDERLAILELAVAKLQAKIETMENI